MKNIIYVVKPRTVYDVIESAEVDTDGYGVRGHIKLRLTAYTEEDARKFVAMLSQHDADGKVKMPRAESLQEMGPK